MKRVVWLLVFALSLMVAGSSYAVDCGVKIGLTVTDQSFDYTEASAVDFDSRKGIEVGAFVGFPVRDFLTISAEVHYVPVGVSLSLPQVDYAGDTIGTIDMSPHVNYLSVPVYLKARFQGGGFAPYLFAGPRLDIKIGADDEGFEELYSEFKDANLGLTLGGGGELSLSPKMRLLFEVAYSPDLAEVYKTDLLAVKNNSLSFLVG